MGGKQLLIVGHVPSPNTLALRDAVAAGAAEEGVRVTALNPFDADADAVKTADAIILGTTENLGYMSGALKDFFDRTYYGVIDDKQGLPYAFYVRAGLDGTGTIRAVQSIATGLRWKPVAEPLLCKGDWDDAFLNDARALGQLMAAGLDAGIF